MNFFQHQDKAKRQTRLLVGLFALAVIAILAAINLVFWLAVSWQSVLSLSALPAG